MLFRCVSISSSRFVSNSLSITPNAQTFSELFLTQPKPYQTITKYEPNHTKPCQNLPNPSQINIIKPYHTLTKPILSRIPGISRISGILKISGNSRNLGISRIWGISRVLLDFKDISNFKDIVNFNNIRDFKDFKNIRNFKDIRDFKSFRGFQWF